MSGQRQYPPSGVLFDNSTNKRNPKAPDWSGNLEITKELLKDLVDRANKGEVIKMQLSAYTNTHPTRGTYLKLTARIDQPFQKGGFQNARRNDDPPF